MSLRTLVQCTLRTTVRLTPSTSLPQARFFALTPRVFCESLLRACVLAKSISHSCWVAAVETKYDLITVKKDGNLGCVGVITLNRPKGQLP